MTFLLMVKMIRDFGGGFKDVESLEEVHDTLDEISVNVDAIDIPDITDGDALEMLEGYIVDMVDVNNYMKEDEQRPIDYVLMYDDAFEQVEDLEVAVDKEIEELQPFVGDDGDNPSNDDDDDDGDDDDKGFIVTIIVLGCTAAVLLAFFLGLFIFLRVRRNKRRAKLLEDHDDDFGEQSWYDEGKVAAANKAAAAGFAAASAARKKLKLHLPYKSSSSKINII